MKLTTTSRSKHVPGTPALLMATAMFFQAPAGGTQETFRLLASDGAESDHFGHAVAISANRAFVGAHWRRNPAGFGEGAVYVYDVRTGQELDQFLPEDQQAYSFGSGVRYGVAHRPEFS